MTPGIQAMKFQFTTGKKENKGMQYNGYYNGGYYANTPYTYTNAYANGYAYPQQQNMSVAQNGQTYAQQPMQNQNQQQQQQMVQTQTQAQPQSQAVNSFVWAWVQGEGGAQAYPVAPNNTVLLMDSDNPILYMKSADTNGRPQTMEVRYLVSKDDYEKLQNIWKVEEKPAVEYVTKEDFEKFVEAADSKYMIRKRRQRIMANPLFNMFGGGNIKMPGPFNDINNVINQYNQFRNTFQGNPQQRVQELMNSGQMTQSQFNQLSQMAQVFRRLLG